MTENENMRSLHQYFLVLVFSLASPFSVAGPGGSARGFATQKFSAAYMNLQCFPKKSEAEVEATKSAFGTNVNGSMHSSGHQAVAGVLDRINQLGAGNLIKNVKVNIHRGGKPWGSKCASCASCKAPRTIELVQDCDGLPPSGFAGTAGHFAHELGHIVGQGKFYSSYQGSVPKCAATSYCTHNGNQNPRNEEFAEVFAMYLHSPDILKNKCPDAYEFMRKNVFSSSIPPEGTCSGRSGALVDYKNSQDPEMRGAYASAMGASDAYSSEANGMMGNLAGLAEVLAAMQDAEPDHKECLEDTPECRGGTWIIKKGESKPTPIGDAVR